MTFATVSYLDELAADLRARAFAPPRHGAAGQPRIGAEVEWIPVERESRRIAPIVGASPTATLPLLREVALERGWSESRSPKGVPVFTLREGGTITFEPGGQIELSTPPFTSATALVNRIQSAARLLAQYAARRGVDLLSVGIDPVNPIECVPLQLHADRYVRQAMHYATIGPAGARMMRQTASIQISIDPIGDGRPLAAVGDDRGGGSPTRPFGPADDAWRLLNALAPYLIAIFANSPRYTGRETGYRSFRAACWQSLDPTRTGLAYAPGDPVARYLDFALNASAFLVGPDPRAAMPFRDWIEERGEVDPHDWEAHLSTLFPEVRPRGYFEVRSIDAVSLEWLPAPVALVAAILLDPESRQAANDIMGEPQPDLLRRAALHGLSDATLGSGASQLFEITLAACQRLGPGFLSARHRETVEIFYDRYTRRGLSPADDEVTGNR